MPKESDRQKNTQREIRAFLEGLSDFIIAEDEEELDGFDDPFVTAEQKQRDSQITKLLTAYVKGYENKSESSKVCRFAILFSCLAIVIFFAGVLAIVVIRALSTKVVFCTSQIIGFVTACVSFISLIIGLLTIITKYFFPEDDEKYITKIVETIQKNDLENKRENAKNPKDEHS